MEESTLEWNQHSSICCICGEGHFYNQCSFVKVTRNIADKEILSRARATLPDSLVIKRLADNTSSVYAKEIIHCGSEFGPLQAQKLITLNPEISFPLKLFSYDEVELSEYFLDTTDEEKCNWMIFIQPASDVDDQNMICYQRAAELFYVAIKDISPGEPLLVWYSPFYALKMNKAILQAQIGETEKVYDPDVHVEDLVREQQKIVPRDTWNCKFCYKLEKNIVDFAYHLIQHYKATLGKKCEVCNASFLYRKDLKKHLKIVHSSHVLSQTLHSKTEPEISNKPGEAKTITIKIVEEPKDVSFGGPLLLNNLLSDSLDNSNLLMQQTDNTNSMDVCNANENPNLLLGDNLSISGDCVINQNVKDFDHFNFELNETTQEELTCDLCLKQCLTLKAIVKHLELHTGKYHCKMCNKIFGSSESVKLHSCNKKYEVQCEPCKKVFCSKKFLQRHISIVHKKKFSCDRCSKHYYSAVELRSHDCLAVAQEDKKRYMCDVCQKVFYNEIYLKRHKQTIHEGIKPVESLAHYVCPVCTKVIKGKRNCFRHMKSHESGSYSCDICDKKFHRSDTLSGHKQLVHLSKLEGSERFKCNQCSKEYKTKTLLKAHLDVHRKTNTHECTQCFTTFKQRSNLSKHVKLIHSDNKHKETHSFKCPCCCKRFQLKSSRFRHMKKLHPNEHKSFEDSKKMAKKVKLELIEDSNKSCDTDQKCRDLKETIEDMDFMADVNDENNGTETIDEFLKENIEIVENLLCNSNPTIPINEFASVKEDVNEAFPATEVCLSMPDLTESDQEIKLGEKAYILENGTIINPSVENPSNVVVYILNEANKSES